MKIAIDLSSLQGPHRFRGIGATIIHFLNNVSDEDKKRHEFVFYIDKDKQSPLNLIKLDGFNYTTVEAKPESPQKASRLPWKLGWPIRALKQLSKLTDFYFGDKRLKQIGKVDVFLQFEQDKSLPRGRAKKVLVLYDLIQYLLEPDYLIGYDTARKKGFSRKSALNHAMHRWIYIHKLRINVKRASKLLAISTQTKNDFIKYTNARSKKIIVVPLGVSNSQASTDKQVHHHHYIASSWGYLKRPYKLEKPYLLFVGGTDSRRRLTELVTAFNHLRARGQAIKLVLVGDVLEGPENIPTQKTRQALENSSYAEDIVYMGFVSDEQRSDLYKKALAFVWPTVYEGFGLPPLEAIQYGTPVMCYDIPTVREFAGNAPLYIKSYQDIVDHTIKLMDDTSSKDQRKGTAKYTWQATAKNIISSLR